MPASRIRAQWSPGGVKACLDYCRSSNSPRCRPSCSRAASLFQWVIWSCIIRSACRPAVRLIPWSVGRARPFGLLRRFHRWWSAGSGAEVPETQCRGVARPGRLALVKGDSSDTPPRRGWLSSRWLHPSLGRSARRRLLWSGHWSSILHGAAETEADRVPSNQTARNSKSQAVHRDLDGLAG